jgi:ribosomal protein S18 acetylase RimI-like enzyme
VTAFTIRPATPDDSDNLKQLAVDNEMFAPDEVDVFDEMLAGSFDGSMEGHRWLVATSSKEANQIAAGAYYAPEPFSDRMWNLYFIATAPDQHGSGVGSALIEHIERELREVGESVARTLIVETSSLEGYETARDFYRSRGFVEEATIREFYGPGDHKVVFWKSLTDEPAPPDVGDPPKA